MNRHRAPDGEKVVFFRHVALPGVEVLAAEDSNRLWSNFHKGYTFCTSLCNEEAHYLYRGRQHHLPGRDGMMLFEPGEIHATRRITGPGTFRVLMIEPKVVEQHFGQPPSKLHLRLAQAVDPTLCRAFRALHFLMESRDADPLEVSFRFERCLKLLWTGGGARSRSPNYPRGPGVLGKRIPLSPGR